MNLDSESRKVEVRNRKKLCMVEGHTGGFGVTRNVGILEVLSGGSKIYLVEAQRGIRPQ